MGPTELGGLHLVSTRQMFSRQRSLRLPRQKEGSLAGGWAVGPWGGGGMIGIEGREHCRRGMRLREPGVAGVGLSRQGRCGGHGWGRLVS